MTTTKIIETQITYARDILKELRRLQSEIKGEATDTQLQELSAICYAASRNFAETKNYIKLPPEPSNRTIHKGN